MIAEHSARRLTAVHEAGHAAAAHLLGVRVESVDVLKRDGRNGHIETPLPVGIDPYGPGAAAAQGVLAIHLILALAGPAAEQIAVGTYDHEGALGDFEDALVFALDMALHTARGTGTDKPPRTSFGRVWADAARCVDLAWTRAHDLLFDNWDAVEELASELLEHGRLGGEKVARVLEEKA